MTWGGINQERQDTKLCRSDPKFEKEIHTPPTKHWEEECQMVTLIISGWEDCSGKGQRVWSQVAWVQTAVLLLTS